MAKTSSGTFSLETGVPLYGKDNHHKNEREHDCENRPAD
jgi:hypothetical protein